MCHRDSQDNSWSSFGTMYIVLIAIKTLDRQSCRTFYVNTLFFHDHLFLIWLFTDGVCGILQNNFRIIFLIPEITVIDLVIKDALKKIIANRKKEFKRHVTPSRSLSLSLYLTVSLSCIIFGKYLLIFKKSASNKQKR